MSLLLHGAPDGAGRLHGALDGFHEHIDHTVAAQTPSPHGLVVRREVEVEQARIAFGHDLGRRCPHVAFEAAPADRADGLPVRRNEEPGALATIRRTLDPNDGRQGELIALGPALFDGAEDVLELAHDTTSVPRKRQSGSCRSAWI